MCRCQFNDVCGPGFSAHGWFQLSTQSLTQLATTGALCHAAMTEAVWRTQLASSWFEYMLVVIACHFGRTVVPEASTRGKHHGAGRGNTSASAHDLRKPCAEPPGGRSNKSQFCGAVLEAAGSAEAETTPQEAQPEGKKAQQKLADLLLTLAELRWRPHYVLQRQDGTGTTGELRSPGALGLVPASAAATTDVRCRRTVIEQALTDVPDRLADVASGVLSDRDFIDIYGAVMQTLLFMMTRKETVGWLTDGGVFVFLHLRRSVSNSGEAATGDVAEDLCDAAPGDGDGNTGDGAAGEASKPSKRPRLQEANSFASTSTGSGACSRVGGHLRLYWHVFEPGNNAHEEGLGSVALLAAAIDLSDEYDPSACWPSLSNRSAASYLGGQQQPQPQQQQQQGGIATGGRLMPVAAGACRGLCC